MTQLGKFETSGELGEYLHDLTMDSAQDSELGDVQDFGWYGLFDDVDYNGTKVYAIVNEDSQGFFNVDEYTNTVDLHIAWSELETEYTEFCEQTEEE